MKLSDYIKAHGYDTFAERVGCSRTMASMLARGDRFPSAGMIRRLVLLTLNDPDPITLEEIFWPDDPPRAGQPVTARHWAQAQLKRRREVSVS